SRGTCSGWPGSGSCRRAWGRISDGTRGGAPVGGSLLQSLVALVIVLAFVAAGADPLTTCSPGLSVIAAIGVMLLMFGASLSVIVFFRKGAGNGENSWQRPWAPGAGRGRPRDDQFADGHQPGQAVQRAARRPADLDHPGHHRRGRDLRPDLGPR